MTFRDDLRERLESATYLRKPEYIASEFGLIAVLFDSQARAKYRSLGNDLDARRAFKKVRSLITAPDGKTLVEHVNAMSDDDFIELGNQLWKLWHRLGEVEESDD